MEENGRVDQVYGHEWVDIVLHLIDEVGRWANIGKPSVSVSESCVI